MTFESRTPRASVWMLVFALVAAACGTQAFSAPGGDADLRELSRYQLTMADVRKFAAVNAELAKHPKREQEESDEDDEGNDDDESLDDMAARIESVPEARQALAAAGLSARQYAVITMALLQASLAQFAVEQGADPAKIAREASVHPANIRFVKEHKAELEQLRKQSGSD